MKTLAIILLAVGLLMTAFTGFTLITKEKVADLGPLEVNKQEKTPIYWSPVTGMVIAGAGIVLFVLAKQKK